MIIERKKNTVRNIFWGVINKLIQIFFPFVIRTILIKKLGSEYVGVSSLFSSILQVLNLAELGFGSALVFSMYKPIAEDDDSTICALLNTYRKIYRGIGSIILTIGIILLPFIKYVIKGDWPVGLNIYLVYFLYLLNTVISYFLFAYRASLLLAYNRNDVVSKISSGVMIFQYVAQIIVLCFFSDYYVYVIVILVSTMALNIAQAIYVTKMYPNYECRGNISNEMRSDIKKRVCGLASYKIYGVVYSAVDTIVISMFLGLIPLALYNNYYYIISSLMAFMTIFTNSMTAGIGNSVVLETVEKNYRDFRQLVFINVWLTSWCFICLTVLFQPFVCLWLGKEYLLTKDTVFLLALMFYASRVTAITFVYREALGLWWEDRLRPLIATLVNLAVNIFLVQRIGLNGVVISTIICTSFINVPWGTHVLFQKYFKQGERTYYLDLIKYSVITFVVCAITYGCSAMIHPGGFVEIILKAVICLIVPNVFFILIYNRRQECQQSYLLLKSIIKRCLRGAYD